MESISVLGLGYVGCVTAACLARLGYQVIGIDKDEHKVRSVLESRAPFYEPGLEDLVKQSVAAGRLTATTSVAEALGASDIALICVGTPSERNGNVGLEQLRRVSIEIGQLLPPRQASPFIVAVRSTVFPGACEDIVGSSIGRDDVTIVANPEFLREGNAVGDFLKPSLVVVGGENAWAVKRIAQIYAPLGVEPCLLSLRAAEMVKYACNAFHAVKIGFANEIGTLCAHLAVDGQEVMQTLCRDSTLNISAAYLKPGFAFGGSCLPKDLRALTFRAGRLDLKLPLLEAVLLSNEQHLKRAIQAVLDLPVERIGVFGLAFKENTDDLRESPVVTLLEQLLGKGRSVRVFDPHIQLDQIYGSNQQFVLAAIPHIGKLMDTSFDQTLRWAEHLVITQNPSAPFAERIQRSGLPLLDLTGATKRLDRVPLPATLE